MPKFTDAETVKEIRRLYREDGLTNKRIGEIFGIHINTVERYTHGYKRGLEEKRLSDYVTELWPIEDVEYLVEWWDKETSKDIGYALDKTRKQVDSKLVALKRGSVVKHKVGRRSL